MDWELESMFAFRALVAAVLGAFIGWEREWHGREAGIRTYAAVGLGSCVFALVSSHIPNADPSRLAANIVTGVGFLGAGIILRDKGHTVGLTTAATVWATAAVGTAVGFGMYPLALLTSILIFGVLAAHHLPGWRRLARAHRHTHSPDGEHGDKNASTANECEHKPHTE